jgi:glycosyltransferase involved in cell wall biosynthesis
MRIAFYAPRNDPDESKPSGDRLMARMLTRALVTAKHDVLIASTLNSFDDGRDPERQGFIEEIGDRIARQLTTRFDLKAGEAPDLWLTFRLSHCAPDWIGPPVASALGIPYVVVDAHYGSRQEAAAWADGHAAVGKALHQAELVIGFNSQNAQGVLSAVQSPDRYVQLKPFIDCTPFASAAANRERNRAAMIERTGAKPGDVLLLAVGMMHQGAKLASYQFLAQALTLAPYVPWHLVIVGDGDAEADVRAAFAPHINRVSFLGRVPEIDLPAIYSGADILVWPAIKETIGVCFLEAQAAGLPVIGSNADGLPDIVVHGLTGLLPKSRNSRDFAESLIALSAAPDRLAAMSKSAIAHAQSTLDLRNAGRAFARTLTAVAEPKILPGSGRSRWANRAV